MSARPVRELLYLDGTIILPNASGKLAPHLAHASYQAIFPYHVGFRHLPGLFHLFPIRVSANLATISALSPRDQVRLQCLQMPGGLPQAACSSLAAYRHRFPCLRHVVPKRISKDSQDWSLESACVKASSRLRLAYAGSSSLMQIPASSRSRCGLPHGSEQRVHNQSKITPCTSGWSVLARRGQWICIAMRMPKRASRRRKRTPPTAHSRCE